MEGEQGASEQGLGDPVSNDESTSSSDEDTATDENALLGTRRKTRERVWPTLLASMVAAIPAGLIGYTIGFSSAAVLDFNGERTSDIPSSYRFSSSLIAAFAALASVGGVVGGLITGPLSDRLGRKNALILSGIPYFTGYLVLAYAQYLPNAISFKVLILVGRFLTGVGMGSAAVSGIVYIAEVSSARLRGLFGSFIQLSITIGLILSYSIGSIPNFPYYYNSLVAAGLTAVFEVFAVMMYETPRWLVAHNQLVKARQSLRWLRGPHCDIKSEIEEIRSAQGTPVSFWAAMKEFRKRSVLVPLIILLFAVMFQQTGGLNAIDSYAASLFKQAGVGNPAVTATYAIGVAQLVAALAVMFFVDLVGRRILLILSGIGMAIGTLLLGVQFYITRPSLCTSGSGAGNSTLLEDSEPDVCNSQYGPLAIVSIIFYIMTFSIGYGPVPGILVSELTPLRVRGVASGLAMVVNWGSAAVVAGVYPPYSDAVTVWGAWWTFAVLNICAALFAVFFLRETKGRSLEEIENYYKTHIL